MGIEEVAVHPVSRIDGGISRTNAGDQPVESREEAASRRAFGTDDPKIVTRDELLRVLGDAQSNGAKLADLARTIEALSERQWIQSRLSPSTNITPVCTRIDDPNAREQGS